MFTRDELTLMLDCVQEYVSGWEEIFKEDSCTCEEEDEGTPQDSVLDEARALCSKLETLLAEER